MKVCVESILECSADHAWSEVQTSRLLLEVMWPVLRFLPPQGTTFPLRWEQGTTILGRSFLLGFVPLGLHNIHFERVDPRRRQIQTREHDRLVRRWDHLISIDEAQAGRCRYSDEIEIEAGWLTWLVWLFAQCFYRHRQRRWRQIARRISRV